MNCELCGALAHEPCERCGAIVHIGDWWQCPHERVQPSKGFEAHFDIGLGREVTGWGDVRQAMRREKLDYREHPSPGTLSARRDRIEQRKRVRERASCENDSIVPPPATVTCDGHAVVLYHANGKPMRRRMGF